ncbi:MAG: hypothetical protein J3K34DRAFT_139752 [Monoraphidium minutum]|nr:MAG: hypothetical protein J3K34DRAFT_139752 [Monoraphidium minutum]
MSSAPRCCWPLHPRSIPSHRAPEEIEGGPRPWRDAERTDQLSQDRPVTEPEVPSVVGAPQHDNACAAAPGMAPQTPAAAAAAAAAPDQHICPARKGRPAAACATHECHRIRASTACNNCRPPYGRYVPTWQAPARRRRHEPALLYARLDVVQAILLHGSHRRALRACARLRPPPCKPPPHTHGTTAARQGRSPFCRALYLPHSQL